MGEKIPLPKLPSAEGLLSHHVRLRARPLRLRNVSDFDFQQMEDGDVPIIPHTHVLIVKN